MISGQVVGAAAGRAPGLPLDEPATDAEVRVGVAALLPSAMSRHGFRLLASVRRRAALGPQARASSIPAPSLPLAEDRSYLEVRTAAKARWLRLWTPDDSRRVYRRSPSLAHSLGRPHARSRMGRMAYGQPSASEEGFPQHGSDGAGAMCEWSRDASGELIRGEVESPRGDAPGSTPNRSGDLVSLTAPPAASRPARASTPPRAAAHGGASAITLEPRGSYYRWRCPAGVVGLSERVGVVVSASPSERPRAKGRPA